MGSSVVESVSAAAEWADVDLTEDVGATALGKHQRQVLLTLTELSTPHVFRYEIEGTEALDFDDLHSNDRNGWVRHRDLTERLIAEYDYSRSSASIQASTSRSLTGLIDRGMVEGLVRAWKMVSTEKFAGDRPITGKPWERDYDDEHDGARPPIQWLRPRRKGLIAAYQLASDF